MDLNQIKFNYSPGEYGKNRTTPVQWIDYHVLAWEKRRLEKKTKTAGSEKIPLTICFSRKIGVGALEIADLLGKKMGYRVADRKIIETIAGDANISKKTAAVYDEKYPGKMADFLRLLFGEKAFIKSDYTRHLFSTVLSIAGLEPTIFVGRGAHLILPRDRVLAVRFICSKDHRVRRLAAIFGVEKEVAKMKLDQIDREQKAFFKNTFGKKDASPYEFDVVVNCDHITSSQWSAEIVAQAFKQKFGNHI